MSSSTRAAESGAGAVALTDHQGLYGAIRFYQKALAAGIKPIIGAEVVVETAGIPGSEADLPPEERVAMPLPTGFGRAAGRGFHLTLLAKDITGYRNLCRLLSRAHVRSGEEDSIVMLSDLERCSEGLIGLSGCPAGEVGASVLCRSRASPRSRDAPDRAASPLATSTSSSCTCSRPSPLATSPHSSPSQTRSTCQSLRPTTSTTSRLRGFRIHDVLASAGARMELPGPYDRPNGELWLKPAEEMRALFAGISRACDATLEIAERCNLDLGLGDFHFPAAEIPRGETPYSVLSKMAWRGLERPLRHDVA